MDLTNLKTVKEILEKNSHWAKKSFGQNFLVNRGILEKITETAEIKNTDLIVEIGPGLGVLTYELAKNAGKVITVELDPNILPIIKQNTSEFNNVEIIHEDALKFSPPKDIYKVVANIPYNITSPLINHFLQAENKPTTMTLLVQKEVAQKICQKEPDMSVLSLQVALFGTAKYIKTVKGGSFFPPPKVDSAIIHITVYRKDSPNYLSNEKALKILETAKKAFSQKRKKLSNTLPELKEKLISLSLNEKRPEHLSIEDWKKLI